MLMPRIDISPIAMCGNQHEQQVPATATPSTPDETIRHDIQHAFQNAKGQMLCGYDTSDHKPNDENKICNPKKRTITTKQMMEHLKLPFDDIVNHTPKTFQAIFSMTKHMDIQLKIPDEMMSIPQDQTYLPNAKRRKMGTHTPLQMRTFSQDEKIPVIMAAYGSQHKINHDILREKGCLAHFIQDEQTGPRLLHPGEIALLHGVTSRYLALRHFQTAWRYLGNQITPLHALMVLTGAFKLMPKFGMHFDMQEVFKTWESQRLKSSNVIIRQGQAGHVMRHMIYDDDITDDQHANIVQFLNEYGKSMLPESKYWDIDGFHPMIRNEDNFHANNTKTASQVTEIDPATPELTLTPTQAFAITLKAILHQDKWTLPFWIASDVTPQDLASLWFTDCEVQFSQGECHLYPGSKRGISSDHNLVVYIADRRLTIYAFHDHQDNFHDFCTRISTTDELFDQFGPITKEMTCCQDTMLMETPLQHGQSNQDTAIIIAAFQNCTEVYYYDNKDDKWCCKLTGDTVSRQIVASIVASAISKPSLQAMGRYVSVKHDTDTTMIEFGSAEIGAAAPPSSFVPAVAIAMTRIIMDTLQCEHGKTISLKWKSRVLWTGKISEQISAEILSTVLMYALAPTTQFREVRLVTQGKQFCSGTLMQFENEEGKPLKIHLAFGMSGGAGPTATKSQLKQQVRNSVASWMLENNIELAWINDNLEKIIDDIGVKRFVPVIQQPSSNKRDSQLHMILKEAAIQMPQPTPKVQQASVSTKNKLRRKHPTMPEPHQFKVDCSFLLKEDGQPTQQLQEFRCNATGIYLTNSQGATPWLRENQQLSSDELAMLVLGPLPVETTLPHESVVVPCFNSDTQQVLLQVTMIQFGAKMVKPKTWDQTATKTSSSKVCALTLWRQDWTEEEWQAAAQSTTQFIKEVFAHDGIQNAITSVWGRSYRKGKQPTTYRDATSIQVHAAIHEDQFMALLKLTGHNKIWAVPKNEDGRLTDDFRIVWLASTVDHPRAATLTAKVAGLAGLVRGKSSLGVRVNASMFDEAWKAIHPNEKPPVDVSNKWIYKLEPFPYGCNSAMLEEWSQHVSWPFRPLKATGPKSWLVCTGESPPQGPLAFNGHPVLPRFMSQKQSPFVQPIIAGPRNIPAKTNAPVQPAAASVPTSQDPWWNYLNRNGTAGTTPQAPTQGPIEQRFAQQDAKVQELESKLEALGNMQSQHTGQIKQLHGDLAATEAKIVQTMHQTLEGVKQELAISFGDALQKQTKQFEANFMDLKKALTQPKRKTPSEGDANMDS